jgi:hypothetical protein
MSRHYGDDPYKAYMRDGMPEPSHVKNTHWRTVEPAPTPLYTATGYECHPIITHEWKKVLIRSNGVSFWAWECQTDHSVYL